MRSMPRSPRLERRSPIAPSSGCVRTLLRARLLGAAPRKLRVHRAQSHALLEEFRRLCFAPQLPLGTSQGEPLGTRTLGLRDEFPDRLLFQCHIRDLGNFTVVGPSGSGKTVFLSFLSARRSGLSRAPSSSLSTKDRGAEIFIRAWAGQYEVLSPGEPTGFNRSRCG